MKSIYNLLNLVRHSCKLVRSYKYIISTSNKQCQLSSANRDGSAIYQVLRAEQWIGRWTLLLCRFPRHPYNTKFKYAILDRTYSFD